MMSKNKKAFSLAEMLIVLSIMGVVAGLTIPTLIRTSPDKNKMMMKKAYYILEQTVSNLINDPVLYPFDEEGNEAVSGFRNTSTVRGCSGDAKFKCLFAKQLNTIEETNCDSGDQVCEIVGTDGIIWKIPASDFQQEDAYHNPMPITIEFDVDDRGSNKDKSTLGVDMFQFHLYYDGKIRVPDGHQQTIDYLKSTKSVK